MTIYNVPNEILRLITSELELKDLARLSSTCTWLRIEAEEVLYTRAAEQDRELPKWPISLMIAAISGSLYAFKRLLEKTEWGFEHHAQHDLDRHPFTRRWRKPLGKDSHRWAGMYRTSLLHIVSVCGNMEMVKLVLEKLGRGLAYKPYPVRNSLLYDQSYRSPLHRAAEMGHVDVMKLLLAAGADINERAGTGSAALEAAVETNQTAAAEFIIRAGADVFARHIYDESSAPFARTCVAGNQYLAKLFLEFGAHDVDNALDCVAGGKDLSMAQFLIDSGAQPGPVALGRAAKCGNLEMLQLLMRNGARFERSVNNTLLHNGDCSPEITALVLNEMPQLANTQGIYGGTPLDSIYCSDEYSFNENAVMSTARCLIEAGGEVNGGTVQDSKGMSTTTLHVAVQHCHEQVVRLLLGLESQKPLISKKNERGRTALHHACLADPKKNLPLVELLISAGIDPHIETEDGKTPLHLAAIADDFKMIPFFLRAGVNVSHQDASGDTALHCVARRAMLTHERIQGFASLAASIILGDMDVTVEDVGGEWVLEYLMRDGHIEAMRHLVAAEKGDSLQYNMDGYTALDIIAKYRLRGISTPIPGNRKLEDMKGAGKTEETRAAILSWISPQEDEGLEK